MESVVKHKVRPVSVRISTRQGTARNVGLSMTEHEAAQVRQAAEVTGAASFSEYVRRAALAKAARDLRRVAA